MSREQQEGHRLDWVASALANAKPKTPSGYEEVWTRLELLLRGELSKRPLPAGELKVAATELASTIFPAQTVPEAEK
jgi:hypothetical protein